MAVIYEIKERRVIPNWRDFKRTLQIGELGSFNRPKKGIDINIDRAINDWNDEQNIGSAADVVNAAYISDKYNFSELHEAIKHIRDNENSSSNTLLQLIELIENKSANQINKNPSKIILEKDVETIMEFQSFINSRTLNKLISRTKNITRNELYNPIIWVELARLYVIHGQEGKAENAILTALHLAPDNRFVLRSATRFFIHTEQFEKALFYLRKSNSLKNDPWLISAHVATSSIMDRFSPLIKDGERLVFSNEFSPFELTELCSSLGTLEFNDGSFKKAKQFFNKSMINPNDNSLAQIEWVSKKDSRFKVNPFSFENVINPFEAYSLDSYKNGNWEDAYYNCLKWFLDVPFSKRPILLGSYVAGSILKDKKAAILLCEIGLQANPFDPSLLNNIVYNIFTSDDNSKASKYLKQLKEINIASLPNESKITIQATFGLVALRTKEIELGKKLYELAIQNSERIKNEYLKNLAIVNYTRELYISNQPEKYKYLELVRKMKIDPKDKDLIEIQKEIIQMENK
jgi:hypothetical protein